MAFSLGLLSLLYRKARGKLESRQWTTVIIGKNGAGKTIVVSASGLKSGHILYSDE
jgi:predicted ATPase